MFDPALPPVTHDGLSTVKAAPRFSFLGSAPSPDAFRKWGKKHNVFLHPDVAVLVPTKTMGLGIFAVKPLKKGSTVVSCNINATLSPYDFVEGAGGEANSPSMKVLSAVKPPLSSSNKVVLRLMAELCRKHSPYRTWLEGCPLMPDHLFQLSAAQKAALWGQGGSASLGEGVAQPFAMNNVTMQMADLDLDNHWEQARRVIADHPDLWSEAIVSEDMYFQCWAQVLSRNFHREAVETKEGPYMLPGVDFINHSYSHHNVEFGTHGGGRTRDLTFDVLASRDIAKGEQVLYNYGDISEARYLIEFQFTNLTSPVAKHCDSVRFSLASLHGYVNATIAAEKLKDPSRNWLSATDVSDRIVFLHREGLLYHEGIFVLQESEVHEGDSAEGNSPFTPVFWNIMHCLTISNEEFLKIRGKVTRHWEVAVSAELVGFVRSMLSLRVASLRESVAAVAVEFAASARLGKLLHVVLEAERCRLQGALSRLGHVAVEATSKSS